MPKVLVVFGTRPEAIKLAPVIKELKGKTAHFETYVCSTDQHQEMLTQVLDVFDITPDYKLGLMRPEQSLFDITVNGLRKIESVLKEVKPDIVLIQGDTTTTFLASLAAYYLKVKVGHVEAGLRSSDKFNPFPEEINRKLTDCLSDFFFVPTPKARDNLLREGVEEEKIFITGNTVIDALLYAIKIIRNSLRGEKIKQTFSNKYGLPLDGRRILLVTSHRRESFGPDFEKICLGLKMIAKAYPDLAIIYPVHLNPNVRGPVNKTLNNSQNIFLTEPLDYEKFVWLMDQCYLVLTDSGGIQEEAPALGKPVLVMRKKTERPEGIEVGTAKLVGVESGDIFQETKELLDNPYAYRKMARAINPYGDGLASQRIVKILSEYL